jgi:7,8-dihydropterin-6-yl-methyl-4-(beta-D-ribofuranosyl)aminobenzene 5'-phosphate synthase
MHKPSPIRILLLAALILTLLLFLWSGGSGTAANSGIAAKAVLRLTVLYDNYVHLPDTQSDWGFSCLIEGTEKTILFDTGTDPDILLHNVRVLKVDLSRVDLVVLSHDHDDHTGGLSAVLERHPGVPVFFSISFPPARVSRIEDLKGVPRAVEKPAAICRGVYLTGEMGEGIKEQSMVIDSPMGLVIVTGCSHPGIVNILRRARQILNRPIHLVMGGFHLLKKSDAEMREIIAAFRELKVEKCGASHCTGDRPIAMFKEAFGDNYVPLGTGKIVDLLDR